MRLKRKPALVVLMELTGNEPVEIQMQSDEQGFRAKFTLDGKEFTGRGISTIIAKNNAFEQALRHVIISKMQNILACNDGGFSVTGDNGDEAMEKSMLQLASFALQKLSNEWQAEGFEIPDYHRELPANHEQLNPSKLLNFMRPQARYKELASEGTPPNIIQRVGITVNGQEYVGVAHSTKDARKAAAREVCNAVFGCAYVAEPEPVVKVVSVMWLVCGTQPKIVHSRKWTRK